MQFLLDIIAVPVEETVAEVTEAVTEAAADSSAVGSMMNNGMTLAEKAADSGAMILRGMGTVFIALIIIWGILELFNVIFHKKPKESKEPATAAEVTALTEAVVPEPQADDTELVAVIAAAVAAYTEQPVSSFRVVSFRRASKFAGWIKSDAE